MVRTPTWLPTNQDLFFLLLLAADALFILLGIGHAFTPYFADPSYSLSRDRGFAEIFQYVQEYWIVGLFLLLAVRNGWGYGVWMLLFGYLLVDDSVRLHEQIGYALEGYFANLAFAGLRGRDFGELLVLGVVGGIFLLLIAFAYWRGSPMFRKVCRRLFLLLVALAFAGVALDMVHIVVGKSTGERSALYEVMTILEDGGEMVIMSVICWYVFSLFAAGGEIRTRA